MLYILKRRAWCASHIQGVLRLGKREGWYVDDGVCVSRKRVRTNVRRNKKLAKQQMHKKNKPQDNNRKQSKKYTNKIHTMGINRNPSRPDKRIN